MNIPLFICVYLTIVYPAMFFIIWWLEQPVNNDDDSSLLGWIWILSPLTIWFGLIAVLVATVNNFPRWIGYELFGKRGDK